jgi:hypothetical protein
METMEQKTARNRRVQARYDQLMTEGKHGHYETMFRVVREEVEQQLAATQDLAKRDAEILRLRGEVFKRNAGMLDAQKQNVLLRDALIHIKNTQGRRAGITLFTDEINKALTATADLEGLILCDAEPFTCGLCGVSKLYKAKEKS